MPISVNPTKIILFAAIVQELTKALIKPIPWFFPACECRSMMETP
jgi:hypothetical protein